MTEFEDEMAAAGDALLALAEGPGRAAADALEEAFGQAGTRIEEALGRAARSGELNFERMAESILRDLARVAAEAVLTMAGIGAQPGGQPSVTLNMNVGAGAGAQDVLANKGAIKAALARAAAEGRRFI